MVKHTSITGRRYVVVPTNGRPDADNTAVYAGEQRGQTVFGSRDAARAGTVRAPGVAALLLIGTSATGRW
jgi:hypothetical protein